MNFLKNLDQDLRESLLVQLRNLWTHASTAIEGNTLTLGETAFVLQEGLTISGKPLKDHEEVVGHARAIDLVYQLVENDTGLSQDRLFSLHRAVQTRQVIDIYKPVGGLEERAQFDRHGHRRQTDCFSSTPPPATCRDLWKNGLSCTTIYWARLRRKTARKPWTPMSICMSSFVRIHPFFDGNGRLARLLANIPVLKAGLPPIIIPKTQRKTYIDALSAYHMVAGQALKEKELLPCPDALGSFVSFCEQAWEESLSLVEEVRKIQESRNRTLAE